MSGDAALDVTDVKAEDENDTNPTIIPRDADEDINKEMLSRPLEPGTKAARYTGPPRCGKMLSFHPGVFRQSYRTFVKGTSRELKKQEEAEQGRFTRWRTNPDEIDSSSIPIIQLTEASDSAQSFEAFHATVIEPNKEAIDRILVEYNKSIHILDQRNDVQFFEKYRKQYTSGYLDDFGRPRTKFSLRPDKALDIHIGFLCTSKEANHDCEHGPSFRYFFSKAAEADETPGEVFFSMPRNARITVKFWEDRVRDVARDTMRETVRDNNWNWAAVLASAVLKRGFAPSEYDLGGFVNWKGFEEKNGLGSLFYGVVSSDESESSAEESSSAGDE
ncbi:uncharacterized protein FPRO_15872 [Fusarium proliferatum ET1]|uniref:Uncharacterized protein n=1 Tax=Fusarium proliferatum (strain ET1) TaxID=1227346 RepID=A0A1L7WA64_FUSPR|nr:uncharacterized protein FPRO_15872 [Fusarium proliferatum ET1]CZR49512.1 uncharacterized protein FPRO_15872 [Fusarium proliferatum ET1]